MSVNIYDASRGKLIRMAPLYKPDIPDGKTVEPANDVQILLKCAGIKDKDYTTISQVMSDTTSFDKIIDTNNSVDYLVRSTDWVSAVCTDNTSMAYIAQSQYAAEQLLDDSTWYSGILNSSYRDVQFLLKTSGIFDKDYTTISQVLSDTTSLSTVINSTRGIDYLVRTTAWASSVVSNANAMTYIGQNNYASNTLLASSGWHDLICNSVYFESVLNTKIPTMTSNTTPAGYSVSSGDSTYGAYTSSYIYRPFDGDDSTGMTLTTYGPSPVNSYCSISVPNAYKVHKVRIYGNIASASTTIYVSASYTIQGKKNGSWINLSNGFSITPTGSNKTIQATVMLNPTEAYSEYRILCSTYNYNAKSNTRSLHFNTLQFYGRRDV